MMKILVCLAVLVLIGASTGMNVNRMDILKEKHTDDRNKNVLFFEPQHDQPNPPNATTCKDLKYSCSGGRPCCEKPGGKNGTVPSCCPYPKAVCCDDKLHCCPNGYQCDSTSLKCIKGDEFMTWLTKEPSKPLLGENYITCPDKERCKDGQTCCRILLGGYGCCPFSEAVCCSDRVHCCPSGYTCDITGRRCTKGDDVMSWLSKLPAIRPFPEQ